MLLSARKRKELPAFPQNEGDRQQKEEAPRDVNRIVIINYVHGRIMHTEEIGRLPRPYNPFSRTPSLPRARDTVCARGSCSFTCLFLQSSVLTPTTRRSADGRRKRLRGS